ncbi:MAG: HEAT repeat domain-containing protein [Thermoguttaceae bacterium]|jgi:HEAT repeat protein
MFRSDRLLTACIAAMCAFAPLGAAAARAAPTFSKESLSSDMPPDVRERVERLYSIGEPARAYALRACQSPDPAVRRGAVRALPAFAKVRTGYRSLDGNSVAFASPPWCGTQLVVDQLLRGAGDSDAAVRLATLESLSRLASCPDKKLPLADAIRAALTDTDPEIRREAVAVVSETDETDKVKFEAIQRLVSDAAPAVRSKAVSALHGLPGERPRAVPLLLDSLKDGEQAVRRSAHEALLAVTRQEIEPDPEIWRKWWNAERDRTTASVKKD